MKRNLTIIAIATLGFCATISAQSNLGPAIKKNPNGKASPTKTSIDASVQPIQSPKQQIPKVKITENNNTEIQNDNISVAIEKEIAVKKERMAGKYKIVDDAIIQKRIEEKKNKQKKLKKD